MPKVSVIMPVYNTKEEYLKEAIESVLRQTLDDFEFIIINDGSSCANIEKVVASYQDYRIKYVYQENQGAGAARNRGILESCGEYLYFLDSDDYIEKNTFEKCFDVATNYFADLVLFCEGSRGGNGTISFISNVHFNMTNPTLHTKFIKADLIKNNNIQFENLKVCNDLTFAYTVLAYAQKVVKINQNFYYYRRGHAEALSASRGKYSLCLFDAFRKLKINLERKNLFAKYAKDFDKILQRCAHYEISNIFDEVYKRQFCDELKTFSPKVYRRLFGFKFFKKVKKSDGRREIYLCGHKVLSYRKKNSIYNDCSSSFYKKNEEVEHA